ncbi:MAG: hypothetical protein IPG21_04705 [Saprospiraceae bacterium]|nr:hypothetical protein [Candidatus Vicinibacter affinis]
MRILFFFLIPFFAFGQYQNSPNKIVLGNQTTGKGLIYYGSGAPAYTPINNKNAYHYVDTTTDVFWYWDFTSMLWDTVTVSGGGGGGTDSQVIDTFTYASDTLKLSMSGDGQMYKYIIIPGSSDDQNIDTFSVVSDTIRLSLQSDGQKYKYINLLPYKDNTDTQTIYWNSGTGNLTIFGGNTISLDGRYLTTEADASITNELQTIDTFSISSNTLRASLSSDGQAFKTVDLSPYLDNTDSQVIDTFSFSSDTLRVSISGDGQKYKTIYLPSVADTDDQSLSFGTKTGVTIPLNIQDGSGVNLDEGTNIEITRDASNYITFKGTTTIDTATYSSDTLKLSLTNDGQATKKIYIPQTVDTDDQTLSRSFDTIFISQGNYVILPVDINTDFQTFDTAQISSDTLRLSLENDMVPVYKFNLKPYLDNTDAQVVDTFNYTLDTLRLSIFGDGEKYKTIYLPNVTDTDDQYIDTFRVNSGNVELSLNGDGRAVSTVAVTSIAPVQAVSAGTGISVSGTSTITVTNTGDLSNTNEIQTIDTFEINSNTLRASLSSDGQAFKTVSLAAYLDNTDSQVVDTFNYSSDTLRLSISGDGQKYKTIYLPNVADTDDQTLSITAGKGTISISEGNSIQLADSSATNEAWTIDGDDADTEVISNQTVKFEGAGIVTTDYVPASDKIIITGTEVDGSITNEIQTIDTLTHSSDTLRISLSSDGQRYKAVYVPTGADDQTIDTFQLSGNTLRLSLEADGQAYKTVDLSKYVDTTFAVNGTRISNDTLYWGSQSSSTDNGSTLIHDTYIWQGGNDITFFNNGDGPDKPSLYLSAVNDVWIGANSTSTAGTAGSADKPSVYFRYGNLGGYSFGVNSASNLNALGNGASNFAKNGLASGNHSRNFQEDGIASSTHSINMGRSGEAKTDSYAWNSGAFGSAANFAAFNTGYDGDATNYYSVNTARVGLASGYSSVNMGQAGVSSGADAKNFGNGGQASGDHAIGFSKFNVTSGNYGMNGSYYTESHAYGQSRWGYFGTDHNSQNASGWVADNILFAIDNGKEDTVRSSALTATARGWFQLRDIGTTQSNISSASQAPKAALEVVSTESGFIPPGGTLTQRNTIWNEGGQTGNFTPTYTKGWQSISGSNIMDQNGLQFQVMNEYGGTSLYALRYNGSGYYWHQIY